MHTRWICKAHTWPASVRFIHQTCTHTHTHTTYTNSGSVELTYGKQAFDSSATPVSEGQVPASPILMFKAPPGTVFLSDVEISIPADKSVLAMLFGSDSESRRHHDVWGNRRLLAALMTVQELKQHWFNTATKVFMCLGACNVLLIFMSMPLLSRGELHAYLS